MSVCSLGIRGLYFEDVPSIVLNTIVLLRKMRAGGTAEKNIYSSLVSIAFSMFMVGRKSSLPERLKELAEKKAGIERRMEARGVQVDKAGLGRGSVKKLALRLETVRAAPNRAFTRPILLQEDDDEEEGGGGGGGAQPGQGTTPAAEKTGGGERGGGPPRTTCRASSRPTPTRLRA
jgi:hypothetical protein